ncbi:hypothetical protein [Marinivivus vitaminiproducens]|uniref:hypothetical protein n=1 Tax=Marinivivus vitaminiproducens TaxID=3035935 RepID=UPI0027A61E30|nr:hypothetical protein P4R82_12930 [Geminicoccaceae bacterium SCSIO 64248]
MGLTLESEQRLEAVNLAAFFVKYETTWLKAAKRAYVFVQDTFPHGATIRPDDVAKALLPVMEVDTQLRDELNKSKLKQKYWISDFVDLIIERTWSRLP